MTEEYQGIWQLLAGLATLHCSWDYTDNALDCLLFTPNIKNNKNILLTNNVMNYKTKYVLVIYVYIKLHKGLVGISEDNFWTATMETKFQAVYTSIDD